MQRQLKDIELYYRRHGQTEESSAPDLDGDYPEEANDCYSQNESDDSGFISGSSSEEEEYVTKNLEAEPAPPEVSTFLI